MDILSSLEVAKTHEFWNGWKKGRISDQLFSGIVWSHFLMMFKKNFLGEKKKEGKNSQQGSRDRNEHPAGADVTNLGGETVPLWCHMGPILQIFVLEPVLLKVEQVLPSLAFLRRSVTNKCDV